MFTEKPDRKERCLFLIPTLVAAAMACAPIWGLLRTSPDAAYYAHIPFIPAVSAFFLLISWRDLTARAATGGWPGVVLAAIGMGSYIFFRLQPASYDGQATVLVLASLVFWTGCFWVFFGAKSLKAALFPVAFLILAVPVPPGVLQKTLALLVSGTAGVAHVVLRVLGVPFTLAGSVFTLPGMDLEILPACSGFRSGLALAITSLAAGQLFLKKPWQRALLILWALPMAVVKSGIRIVVLYALAYHVDIEVMDPGNFVHRFTGYVAFLIALAIMGLMIWLMNKPGYFGAVRPDQP